ncbi:MAG TPA: 23S rRNA (adenine(2503)-C(2))-methyltransferase RlmN [Candidatus Hydrogenedentes bacterium]|nr:23S rRNA (adenine(2503)-C(2))-methyltransferase RlmN [Candidatus Hydrogenedentota bacterium]HOS03945.1 23S rRNA (adenine(2503)-C(2))-methyltransferase RlmN [Candidatus Hydrogenedentota bacterium]
MTIALTDLLPDEIAAVLCVKPYQGKQIFQWMHRRSVFDPQAMTDLPKDLRRRIAEQATVPLIERADAACSMRVADAQKALFRLKDGETIESVLLRDRNRVTVCVSTQAGCALKCVFCATGLSGFTRNLSPGEIAEQVTHLLAEENLGGTSPNIVYMGMGEPFRNYDAVMKSIRLLMAPEGWRIGARKITVSTAGDVDGIRKFAAENWQVRLSVSLHAANDALRSKLVPLNRVFPIDAIIEAVRDYQSVTGRQVTIEWTLMQDINDSLRDAQELAALLRGLKASVNVIPLNPVTGVDFKPPSFERCREFQAALVKQGIAATLRRERGQEIDAACGQLRRRRHDA